jgi:hypothetical protein
LKYKSLLTFSVILGIVGGIASVIFSALPVIMWWYQMFHYESQLVRNLYKETTNSNENPLDLKDKINSTKPLVYRWRSYMCMLFLKFCCCCCRDRCYKDGARQYEKYFRARKRLEQEFDFLELVKKVRVLSMLTSALLAKRQAVFVGYADKFLVKPDKQTDMQLQRDGLTVG